MSRDLSVVTMLIGVVGTILLAVDGSSSGINSSAGCGSSQAAKSECRANVWWRWASSYDREVCVYTRV